MYARRFFNWLVPPLRPIEAKILSAVEAKLRPSLAVLFRAQVKEINYVQRRQKGHEVGLYVIRAGRVARDETLRIPMAGREWRLACVRQPEGGANWMAAVYLADGHLCSIEYDKPPGDGETDDINVYAEVLEPPSRALAPSESTSTIPDWLRPYANRFGITSIDPPLVPSDRTLIIAELDVALPSDYIDFVAGCNGVQLGALSVLGLSEAYGTRALGIEYIVLGQVNGKGLLAVRKPGPTTVFIDFGNDSIMEFGPSLQVAIEHAMAT